MDAGARTTAPSLALPQLRHTLLVVSAWVVAVALFVAVLLYALALYHPGRVVGECARQHTREACLGVHACDCGLCLNSSCATRPGGGCCVAAAYEDEGGTRRAQEACGERGVLRLAHDRCATDQRVVLRAVGVLGTCVLCLCVICVARLVPRTSCGRWPAVRVRARVRRWQWRWRAWRRPELASGPPYQYQPLLWPADPLPSPRELLADELEMT